MKRVRTSIRMRDIPGGLGFRDQRPKWAGRFGLRHGPVEAIPLAGGALELLGIGRSAARQSRVQMRVLPLGGHVRPAHTNRVEFILANVPVDDLLFTGRRIKMPLPIHSQEGNGQRPVIRANLQSDFVRTLCDRLTALRHRPGKPLRIVRILDGIAG